MTNIAPLAEFRAAGRVRTKCITDKP